MIHVDKLVDPGECGTCGRRLKQPVGGWKFFLWKSQSTVCGGWEEKNTVEVILSKWTESQRTYLANVSSEVRVWCERARSAIDGVKLGDSVRQFNGEQVYCEVF